MSDQFLFGEARRRNERHPPRTEGQVDDDAHRPKVGVKVTMRVGEVSRRRALNGNVSNSHQAPTQFELPNHWYRRYLQDT